MITLNVQSRKKIKKIYNKNLRLNKKIPAIIYNKFNQSFSIELKYDDVINIYQKKVQHKKLILVLNKIFFTVKIHDVQYHPVKNTIIHIDFIKV